MNRAWFLALAILVGLAGTHTALRHRQALENLRKPGESWFLLILGWLPLLFWFLATFVAQD